MTPKENSTLIHYFERAGTSYKFQRVYANLVHLAPHKLTVKIKSEIYTYPCAYDLQKMLYGNVLAVFAHTAAGSTSPATLYPLPKTAVFSEECTHITFIPSETFSVLSDPRYIAIETEFQEIQQKIKDKYQILQQMYHDSVAFAEDLPTPKKYHLNHSGKLQEPNHSQQERSVHQRKYKINPSGKKKILKEQIPLIRNSRSKREAKKLEEKRDEYII
jgi:hypothetical protein